MKDHGVEDRIFLDALYAIETYEDPDYAKNYGLQHWAKLSESSREAWTWVFGRENRQPGWATRDLPVRASSFSSEEPSPPTLREGCFSSPEEETIPPTLASPK
jgi:hypothetical protein